MVSKEKNFSEWYNNILDKAENAPQYIDRYVRRPTRPMVTVISTNILWARSKRVSEPIPAKNLGLKYFEKGILKFSGPQPRRMVLGLSLQPLSPACQAQKRV